VRDILKMIIVLTIIGAVSGLVLSLVYEGTKAPIEYQTIKFVKEPAVKKVLTGYDNDPIADRKKIRIGEDERGNPIDLKEGKLLDIGITSHSETPGIGARVSETFFTDRFKGLATTQEVTVDGISGATYSSAGVMAAVTQALGYVTTFSKEIFS